MPKARKRQRSGGNSSPSSIQFANKKPPQSVVIPQDEPVEPEGETVLISKAKPIVIESTFNVIKRIISSINLKASPIIRLSRISTKKLTVTCLNVEDKQKVISELRKAEIAFHSFAEPSEKPMLFIVKGLD